MEGLPIPAVLLNQPECGQAADARWIGVHTLALWRWERLARAFQQPQQGHLCTEHAIRQLCGPQGFASWQALQASEVRSGCGPRKPKSNRALAAARLH